MRLGVTGRSRTGTSGFTAHGSSIELRPHPSARNVWSRWQVSNLRPRDPKSRALPSAPHREENWYPRVGTIHRPPPYQDGALPLSYARSNWTGSPTWFRTTDLLVNSQALCHLRYRRLDSTVRFERTRACAAWFAARCLRPLGYVEMNWHRTTESNRQPSALEAAALPIELAR